MLQSFMNVWRTLRKDSQFLGMMMLILLQFTDQAPKIGLE
jgi:hypothetical protein